VKAFHNEGIAVIMDVVYNHVSNYDYHPLKYIDKEMYFRLDSDDNYISKSGCGNDTQSENPAMSQLILESVKYWMTHYHIDGFRFDLGNLIDRETRQKIIHDLRQINPHAIIIAEPWGDGYDPSGFSKMGWASFNDQFRDGLNGSVFDVSDKGFLLGSWRGKNDKEFLKRIILGSQNDLGGQYFDVSHSVNYLECHDNHTFGDRLRISGGFITEHSKIVDKQSHSIVNGSFMNMNKLGALFLFTSQGIVFMHEGQEWARSKIIAESNITDEQVGMVDHNSYEKDNETNWLNWNEKEKNLELVDYYKGLIQVRKRYSEFRHSNPEDYEFIHVENKMAIAYLLKNNILVAMNGDTRIPLVLNLPKGDWHIIADSETIDIDGEHTRSNSIVLPSSSGLILINSNRMQN
jgi:pullulanase/glycogen debranching enzyme